MNLKHTKIALTMMAVLAAGPALADREDGIPHLDHAFVIVMENHYIDQILSPSAPTPFIQSYAKSANLAANYYGVAHPSLTNYLEIVGGSNFGILNDNNTAWHSGCESSLEAGTTAFDTYITPSGPANCPIKGTGTDAATPQQDCANEAPAPLCTINTSADPTDSYAAQSNIEGKSIADQLVAAGKTWKTYQENLPAFGADGVNWSDGLLTNATPKPVYGVPHLYAAKHNPFVYFANVQAGTDPRISMKNVVGFEQLYADLGTGHVPAFSLIAPNQCHDQHGRGTSEVGPGCSDDAGTVAQGDATVAALVSAIKASPAWSHGHNAIVVVWDENDYALAPETNQVVTIVDTNYGVHGVSSNVKYNHFSLLKSLEEGFGLPCLNHACDPSTSAMTDLFAAH